MVLEKHIILALLLSITSSAFADDLDPKGLVFAPNSPTDNLHALDDEQCWRVLDAYSAMSETGRARIEGIAANCRSRMQGKPRPTQPAPVANAPGHPTGFCTLEGACVGPLPNEPTR